MARETVIPSVSVEVVKEVVPPSPAATGIVAILGTTEKGPLLKPTRIGRYPEFIEEFGVGSAYSMPEAKQALQNGAKELVIVRLENRSKAYAKFKSIAGNDLFQLTARVDGVYGNEIKGKISESKSKAEGTFKVEVYYLSDKPVETFDNLSLNPEDDRYVIGVINSQSELVYARNLRYPVLMGNRRSLSGTDAERARYTLNARSGAKDVLIIEAREFGASGNNIKVSVGPGTNGSFKISIEDSTDIESLEVYDNLVLDDGAEKIANTLSAGSKLISAQKTEPPYTFDGGDALDTIEKKPLIGGVDFVLAALPTPPLQDTNGLDFITVTAKEGNDGFSGDGIYIKVYTPTGEDESILGVWEPDTASGTRPIERYPLIDPEGWNHLIKRVNEKSKRIRLGYVPETDFIAIMTNAEKLNGGSNPGVTHFETGLTELEKEPDVDIVVPSIQYPPPSPDSTKKEIADAIDNSQNIFAAVDAHCKNMSDAACNRIGYGSVSRMESLEDSKKRTETFASDRFVITAPHGVVGAVAGLVGRMTYFYSPTFKAITGLTTLERDFSPTDLRKLLGSYIVPLDAKKGRGLIIIRGLTTDGDQISVRRVADYAVRNVKNIAERFIGNLNTQDGRDALKQKIFEFLQQMEKDTAIVPSTDGTDPAFKVDVYSTQRDFALGIVRLDIAVRPVRAMDYIYATILVQV